MLLLRRRIGQVLILLLLGAVVNVAVAWGLCVMNLGCYEMGAAVPVGEQSAEVRSFWFFCGFRRSGGNRLVSFAVTGNPTEWPFASHEPPAWSFVATAVPREFAPADDSLLIEDARGWPSLALLSRHVLLRRTIEPSVVSLVGLRIDASEPIPTHVNLGWLQDHPRALPLRPLFPGFLINTLFYAAVLWLLLFAPFAARRLIRRRRGRCPQCGYDLRGSSGGDRCPECGKGRPSP